MQSEIIISLHTRKKVVHLHFRRRMDGEELNHNDEEDNEDIDVVMEQQNEGDVYFYFTMYMYASIRVSHIYWEHKHKNMFYIMIFEVLRNQVRT